MARTRLRPGLSTSQLPFLFLIGSTIISPAFGAGSNHHSSGPGDNHAPDFGQDDSLWLGKSTQQDHSAGAILNYKPIFNALKEAWSGKEKATSTPLSNNRPSRQVIAPGATQQFIIPLSELVVPRSVEVIPLPDSYGMQRDDTEDIDQELRKRDDTWHRIYLTLSICRLPTAKTAEIYTRSTPPDLNLSIPISARNDLEEANRTTDVQHLKTREGYISLVDDFPGDVSFQISAPDAPGYTGMYTYEVTASIDDAFTNFNDYESLHFVDSDDQAVMLTTTHLTDPRAKDENAIDAWINTETPFTVFVHEKDDPHFTGLRRSYCGLAESALVHSGSDGARTRMTTLGGITAKQEFHVPGLEAGASYSAVLGLPSNFTKRGAGVPTGGGMVWRQVEFQTTQGSNCTLISNLTFCESVNYKVPQSANSSSNFTFLADTYDNYAQASYSNFNISLQQIPCNTNPESQYSLATNCSNCDNAYRQWICAVTIPRCADPSITSNPFIPQAASDSTANVNFTANPYINPQPYKALPPCGNLCFGLVQNCPALLQFGCPLPNTWEYNQTYGYLDPKSNQDTCNGAHGPWGLNGSGSLRPSLLSALFAAAVASALTFNLI